MFGFNQQLQCGQPDMHRAIIKDDAFRRSRRQTRVDYKRLLLRVRDHAQKTVLFVTHDIKEAILMADRVIVMSGRPCQIRKILTVDFARPRLGNIVSDPAFIAMKREIVDLLQSDKDDQS